MSTIGILIFDGAEELDFVGPWEVFTAAGVSAGIDMALWLTGQLHGEDFARQVQKYIEYYPEPPYAQG